MSELKCSAITLLHLLKKEGVSRSNVHHEREWLNHLLDEYSGLDNLDSTDKKILEVLKIARTMIQKDNSELPLEEQTKFNEVMQSIGENFFEIKDDVKDEKNFELVCFLQPKNEDSPTVALVCYEHSDVETGYGAYVITQIPLDEYIRQGGNKKDVTRCEVITGNLEERRSDFDYFVRQGGFPYKWKNAQNLAYIAGFNEEIPENYVPSLREALLARNEEDIRTIIERPDLKVSEIAEASDVIKDLVMGGEFTLPEEWGLNGKLINLFNKVNEYAGLKIQYKLEFALNDITKDNRDFRLNTYRDYRGNVISEYEEGKKVRLDSSNYFSCILTKTQIGPVLNMRYHGYGHVYGDYNLPHSAEFTMSEMLFTPQGGYGYLEELDDIREQLGIQCEDGNYTISELEKLYPKAKLETERTYYQEKYEDMEDTLDELTYKQHSGKEAKSFAGEKSTHSAQKYLINRRKSKQKAEQERQRATENLAEEKE